MCDKFLFIGDVPEGTKGNVASCGYCLSPVSGSVKLLPLGSGIPIPSQWACVDKGLIEGLVLPDDISAAMIRVAVHLASEGIYFNISGETAFPVASDVFYAEVSKDSGQLRFLNSRWLMGKAAKPGELPFAFSGAKFKPMIVSSNMSWSTKAVFDGYVDAFSRFGVDFYSFEYDQFMKMFSEDIVRKILMSEVCDIDNGVTHMIVIDGMAIPENLILTANKMGITTAAITTEDPHSIDHTRKFHSIYDYVFSNDLNAAEMFGVHYLPTAADFRCAACDETDVDVLFVGAIYPNRCRVLEGVVESCLANDISIRVVGPIYKCQPHGFLADIVEDRIVSTEECLKMQSRAKVCLNLFRDACSSKTGHNTLQVIPYSLNPRCYDVPVCGSTLLTDYRPEVVELFGEECLLGSNPFGKIQEVIKKCDSKEDIRLLQKKTVEEGHSYLHRTACLLSVIGQGFFIK